MAAILLVTLVAGMVGALTAYLLMTRTSPDTSAMLARLLIAIAEAVTTLIGRQ